MKVKKTMLSTDGNTAAALGSYLFSEVAAIYPITPSSPMAELVDIYAAQGKKNVYGNPLKVIEMQSEAGAAGAVHGALQGGTIATTYTASQGLLLMIPNIYKWVGEMLPAVIHVAARSIAAKALSIFGDHQDIYAARQTGACMICSHSVQEIADLAPLASLVALEAKSPVLHFFDGFRSSHEIQNIEYISEEDWKKLTPTKSIQEFKDLSLNPHSHPVTRGGAENDDIYFQGREASNLHTKNIVTVAKKYFEKVSKMSGRNYAPFTYYGHPEATDIIVAMGSVTETTREVIDVLTSKGKKVGMVKVHLYRPFSAEDLVETIPTTVKRIAVLDRTKEPGSEGEPLFLDVVAALKNKNRGNIKVIGGRYGLSSKDVQPYDIKGVYDFIKSKDNFHGFTVGINDDVTHLSIPVDKNWHIDQDYTSCLFYGLGSDGTVSANKSSIKIIGDATGKYAQAYFAYDSRKAGGVTRSHLRFGDKPIHSTYYIKNADFISCSLDSYLYKFEIVSNLKQGGTFLLNTTLTSDELVTKLPNRVKKELATKNAKFYIIDANKIASELGMGRHTNTTLQSTFFFLNQQIMKYETAVEWMKKFAKKTYEKKGMDVVEMNYKAIDAGTNVTEVKVDPSWKDLKVNETRKLTGDSYFDSFVTPIGQLDGYELPVSLFTKYELNTGTMNNNVTRKEERSVADRVPHWIKENCIQCNQCAFVCPHATIRPFLLTEEEINNLSEEERADVLPAMGGQNVKGLQFRIQVDPRNCVGCTVCVSVCPGKGPGKKALEMVEAKQEYCHQDAANYLYTSIDPKLGLYPDGTVKEVSFMRPYHEVSGACAGCGETPYYRLVSQLFGRDMLVANATGCSSIYCGSIPATPFVKDKNGEGIAWGNSLFEDNAEFGFGMRVSQDYKLDCINTVINNSKETVENPLKELLSKYQANIKDRKLVRDILPEMLDLINKSKSESAKELLVYKNDILDKSVWIVGGDGWAYDIGYGGLDHVLANKEDVNILVLDTEVYSNTGGQSSKSSQTGSIAKFTASGKRTGKKNLALMAMAYEHVYVAQVAMGANPMQTIKALKEAESYNGPSLIIAYSPCIEHGIKGGLANAQITEKKAVECGYFQLFRYDPRLLEQGKNPLTIDSREPDWSKFREFLLAETRYGQLSRVNPDNAERLLSECEEFAKRRQSAVKRLGTIVQ